MQAKLLVNSLSLSDINSPKIYEISEDIEVIIKEVKNLTTAIVEKSLGSFTVAQIENDIKYYQDKITDLQAKLDAINAVKLEEK